MTLKLRNNVCLCDQPRTVGTEAPSSPLTTITIVLFLVGFKQQTQGKVKYRDLDHDVTFYNSYFTAEENAFSIIIPEMKDAIADLWSDNDFQT